MLVFVLYKSILSFRCTFNELAKSDKFANYCLAIPVSLHFYIKFICLDITSAYKFLLNLLNHSLIKMWNYYFIVNNAVICIKSYFNTKLENFYKSINFLQIDYITKFSTLLLYAKSLFFV